MRQPARPFLLMGPDIHGPALYSRHRTLAAAERRATWQHGKAWRRTLTIVRVVSQGRDLNAEERAHERRERAAASRLIVSPATP